MRQGAIVVLVLSLSIAACTQGQSNEAAGQPQDLAGSASVSANSPASAAAGEAPGAGRTASEAAQPTLSAGTASAPVPGASGASALAAPGGRAAAVAAPAFDEVTVPAGTSLALVLDTPVASDASRIEGAVRAHLARPVSVNGTVAIPAGSSVTGTVTEVERAGKVQGLAHIAFRFHELTRAADSERYRIETSSVSRTARATKGKDAAKVGGGALGGAIVGGIIGGKKGAAIGTAAGAGAGGAVVMSTRGEEVRLGRGASVSVRLSEPITVRVPR